MTASRPIVDLAKSPEYDDPNLTQILGYGFGVRSGSGSNLENPPNLVIFGLCAR